MLNLHNHINIRYKLGFERYINIKQKNCDAQILIEWCSKIRIQYRGLLFWGTSTLFCMKDLFAYKSQENKAAV